MIRSSSGFLRNKFFNIHTTSTNIEDAVRVILKGKHGRAASFYVYGLYYLC